MKKMSPLLTILYLGILLALTACSPTPTESGLVGSSWRLTSYGDIADPHEAVSGIETSLAFGADGKISGSLGCNSMGGDYSISGQNITFGSVFATEMACDDARMAQEGEAFKILQGTASFKLDGNTLTIRSSDGNSVLIFAATTHK
jgi:heat shock protein HslJ